MPVCELACWNVSNVVVSNRVYFAYVKGLTRYVYQWIRRTAVAKADAVLYNIDVRDDSAEVQVYCASTVPKVLYLITPFARISSFFSTGTASSRTAYRTY